MDTIAFYINRLEGLTGHEKLRILERGALGKTCGSRILQQEFDGLEEGPLVVSLGEGSPGYHSRMALAAADHAAWQRGTYGVLGLWEPEYPQLLREIWDPPFLLWYRGRAPQADGHLCSVVGTRKPTGEGRMAAWNFAHSAARCGVGVVSGLAYGIDGAAHAGALDGGGYTIAILAGGIDRIIPSGHRSLGARILDEGGCIASEFAPGVGVQKYFFPRRNRIISGLSPQLVVVEAPRGSGALISARQSLDEGRDVFVHRNCLDSCQGDGIRDLAALGAIAVDSMDELLQS